MTPRWLFNENVPRPSVEKLRAAGWEVLSVAERLPGSTDIEVLAFAREQQCWLATFDRDYGELVFRRGVPPPPLVLLFRVLSYSPDEPAGWVTSLYAGGQFREGHFHIYDGHTMRRRPLTSLSTKGSGSPPG